MAARELSNTNIVLERYARDCAIYIERTYVPAYRVDLFLAPFSQAAILWKTFMT